MKTTERVARSILTILVAIHAMPAVPVLILALLLVTLGETIRTRLFASAVVLFVAVPVVLWASVRWRKRIGLVIVGVLAGAIFALLCVCYGLSPNGSALPGSRVGSHYGGAVSYKRASVANLVPEVDQVKLGTYVAAALDPFIDHDQAARIRGLILDIYREMGESEEFECLGSVMNYVYRDMFLNSRPTGHFYEYLPASGQAERLPVVLFLHGSMGNFKAYLWVWKRFADRYGFAIVAPSFGMGNWDREGGAEAIERVRQYCSSHPRMNDAEIYLVGLSNGAKGVSRAASRTPQAYKALIFISPVMEPEVLLSDRFLAGWQGRRILVLHGAADRRIPAAHVAGTVRSLSKRRIDVDARYYPNEDHFLLFSSWPRLSDDMSTWIKQE